MKLYFKEVDSMKKSVIRLFSITLAVIMAVALFAGCTKTETPAKTDTTAAPAETKSDSSAPQAKSTRITNKDITLKYWCDLPADKVAPVHKSYSETELYKELERRTGIKIEFLHPAAGQATEQFNLMIASRELPDIFERNFGDSGSGGYPGGPEKALADGIIIKLNDLIDQYAPNIKKIMNSNKEYERDMKTDNGNIYAFPFIRGDDSLMVFFGPQFRKDFLDELNLPVPETIDEWYTTLKAFKEKLNIEFPFSFRKGPTGNDLSNGNGFVGAWGVGMGFYLDGERIKFGPMEPGYKEFLATLKKWYDEKLIDPDFASMDLNTWRAKVTGDKTGAFLAYTGGGMGYFYDLMKKDKPNFTLVGAPNPVLKKGEKSRFGQKDWPVASASVSITTANKYPKESVMWLDYAYGEEGHMLFNFGIEGKSYRMENGYPKYTEWITNNPDGKSMSLAMSTYMRSHHGGPFVQDKRYFEQFMKYPDQVAAVNTWAASSTFDSRIPRITLTPEESTEFATIMTEINTYNDEMFLKFVLGQEPLDNFDSFVAQLKKMKIERVLEIQQAALERYYKR